MSNQIQVNEAMNRTLARDGFRRRIVAGALSATVAVTCALAANAHAANAPFFLTFGKAPSDLPIVMPVCCQGRAS